MTTHSLPLQLCTKLLAKHTRIQGVSPSDHELMLILDDILYKVPFTSTTVDIIHGQLRLDPRQISVLGPWQEQDPFKTLVDGGKLKSNIQLLQAELLYSHYRQYAHIVYQNVGNPTLEQKALEVGKDSSWVINLHPVSGPYAVLSDQLEPQYFLQSENNQQASWYRYDGVYGCPSCSKFQ